MKVGIIGGGISGLSTAYYLKKLRLPVSQITIFEASNRLGGWVNSKRIEFGGDTFYFEKGPRTLRLSTLEPKEINSIELAKDLNLDSSIQLVSKDHPASRNRFIYFNNKINAIQPKLFGKSELLGKSILAHLFKEFRTKPRDPSVEDESLWSFIERRFDSTIADNLVDPVFKGICGGDVKKLSSAAFVENIYNNELKYGSITKGVMKGKSSLDNKPNYPDLLELRKSYTGQSVWRLKNGTEEMITKLADHLSNSEGVKIHLNEPLIDLDVDQSKTERSIKIKSKSIEDDFDIVISAINSKLNNQFLPEKYQKLKELLNKIDTVNMVVVNMYFKKDILPVKGFGYLVPTNQKSAILGCIFDSVLDEVHKDHTVLTVMMGGAWFDEYIGSKSNDEIYNLALNELKKHLNIQIDPDVHEVNVLKNSIPQYRVGHLNLLKQIDSSLQELKLDKKLYLTGWSYNGIGVNDCIFNGRKLVQEKLMKTNN